MIDIKKKVSRRTTGTYNVLKSRQPRQVIVSIAPGDILEFREKGRRGRFQIAIDTVFRYAIKLKADSQAREKRARRLVKRGKL